MDKERDAIKTFYKKSGEKHIQKVFDCDAQLFRVVCRELLFTVDEYSAEDFFIDDDPFRLGWNLAVATMSDILAGGGIPIYYAHSMTIPASWDQLYLERFGNGIRKLLSKAGAEFIGGEGQVAVIVHDQTSRTGIDRRDGFVNQIEAEYPNIEIVDIQYGGGDQLKSTDLAKAIIQAHPDLKGFFGANEGSIIGVMNAVNEMGKEGEIVIIGYDSGKQQTDAIRSGLVAGSITQDPIGIGYKCVEAAVMALNGEEVPAMIDTGFHWYDADNIDSDTIAPLLYE